MRAAARARAEGARCPASASASTSPGHERRLGPDHDQVDLALARGRDDPVDVLGGDVEALDPVARDAGVAGRGEQLGPLRAAQQRAHERVLAAARRRRRGPV